MISPYLTVRPAAPVCLKALQSQQLEQLLRRSLRGCRGWHLLTFRGHIVSPFLRAAAAAAAAIVRVGVGGGGGECDDDVVVRSAAAAAEASVVVGVRPISYL